MNGLAREIAIRVDFSADETGAKQVSNRIGGRARLAARELGGLAGFFLVFGRPDLLVHPGARFFGGDEIDIIRVRLEFDGIDQAPLLPALLAPSPGASDAVSSIAGSAKTHF